MAMLQYAWYSVISPEACSSILFRGPEQAEPMAEALHLTADHLKRHGVIDEIVPEPLGGAHRDPRSATSQLEQYLARTLRQLKEADVEELVEARYAKFRAMGTFAERG